MAVRQGARGHVWCASHRQAHGYRHAHLVRVPDEDAVHDALAAVPLRDDRVQVLRRGRAGGGGDLAATDRGRRKKESEFN